MLQAAEANEKPGQRSNVIKIMTLGKDPGLLLCLFLFYRMTAKAITAA